MLDIVPWSRYLLGLQTKPLNISHPLLPTTPSVLQSSITNSSHTNCVDYRTLACHADSRTVPYSWRSWLSTDLLCSEAGCRLKASGSLPDCKTANWLHSEILVLKSARASRHLPQLFIYALKRVGYRGDVCCPCTMYSSGFILGIANHYHGYRFAVEWQRHRIPGNLLHRQPVTVCYTPSSEPYSIYF
jgi:hypothetical protein